ncbi:MAG: hypothetical protein U9N87_08080 [Planctomycetota bacterium]|nr:hypothetical protein [Planctomycetota bacterium]
MERRIGKKTAWAAACGLGLLLLAGCGPSSDRQALEGTVTLDGAPLAEGSITLRPLPGTRGPPAGGKISEGKFSVSPEEGTFAGTFRVEITASRKTGRQVTDQFGNPVDEMAQYIPTKYNRQSELTVEIKADTPNKLKFDLASQ